MGNSQVEAAEEDISYLNDLRKYASQVRGVAVTDEEIIAMVRAINPETCEVDCGYGQLPDPYGVVGVRPEESCVGRQYWARSPGCDVWINFVSLPESVPCSHGQAPGRRTLRRPGHFFVTYSKEMAAFLGHDLPDYAIIGDDDEIDWQATALNARLDYKSIDIDCRTYWYLSGETDGDDHIIPRVYKYELVLLH